MSQSEEAKKILDEIFNEFQAFSVNNTYYLRQYREKDATLYHKFYNSPEVAKYLPDSMIPKDIEVAKDEIKYWQDIFKRRECVYWAIAKKDNDELVGGCGFNQWSRYHGRIEIAYDLMPEYWRQGIMKQALPIIIQYAFIKMRVTRIQATIVDDNIRSRRLLEDHLGFTYEGTLRKYKFFKGQFIDVLMFGLTIEDFMKKYGKN
jgi:ribosomal-protein-alanine N-acetyltransferase